MLFSTLKHIAKYQSSHLFKSPKPISKIFISSKSMSEAADNHLVWVDLEMTGLDIDKDVIIEIACLITDKDLNIVAEGNHLKIKLKYLFYI